MNTTLVTGPAGFLGYHVVKSLNARGIRPRVLLPAEGGEPSLALQRLKALDIDVFPGDVDSPDALRAACDGVDTLFHLRFTIALGSGEKVRKSLYDGNVVGTRNLLEAAADAGVRRVVVSSSSLTVGLNPEPHPLDETAEWERYAFHLPYAESRREAELEALNRPGATSPEIVVVNPSFTLGPEDYAGAPANGLVMKMTKPGFRLRAPIGFGVLDVRDYADGALRAAEQGKPGQRYILSGANVSSDVLLKETTRIVGIEPARWTITLKAWALSPIIRVLGLWSRTRGEPAKVSIALLELWDRHAWYDTGRAREDLGWQPRPLEQTLEDTIHWMQENASDS